MPALRRKYQSHRRDRRSTAGAIKLNDLCSVGETTTFVCRNDPLPGHTRYTRLHTASTPLPRAVIPLDTRVPNQRLKKTLRSGERRPRRVSPLREIERLSPYDSHKRVNNKPSRSAGSSATHAPGGTRVSSPALIQVALPSRPEVAVAIRERGRKGGALLSTATEATAEW